VDAIKKDLGDIPIIISIRNPVERAYSAYNNLLRDGREKMDFLDALNMEEERLAKNWDWMWAYKKGGLYSDAIEHFQNNFSKVKVVLFDDLENNPDKVVQELFDFLAVDNTIQINSETKYSHSGKPKNSLVAILTDRNNKTIFALRKMAMDLIPRSWLESIASKILSKDLMPEDSQKYLQKYFREDIDKLEKLIGRDLSQWR